MNPWLAAAGLLGAAGVVLGALGSHALTVERPDQFELANRYHLIHAVLIAALSLAWSNGGVFRQLVIAGFVLGTMLFCGSLYLSSLNLAGSGLAPVGGSMLIISWAALAAGAFLPQKK